MAPNDAKTPAVEPAPTTGLPPDDEAQARWHRLRREAAEAKVSLGERSVLVADPVTVEAFARLKRLAAGDQHALIEGRVGTGKATAAWAMHYWSPRAAGPFVAIHCAPLLDVQVEATFFGGGRGADDGAVAPQPGLFERAHGGTLFLEEVAELSPRAQGVVLRAVERQRVPRPGDAGGELEVDVRVVAATCRELRPELKAGRFRRDLYDLLSARVTMPPLRERPRELALLALTFLDEGCAMAGRPPLRLSPAALDALSAYRWPGNMHELRPVMEFLAFTCSGMTVEPRDLPALG